MAAINFFCQNISFKIPHRRNTSSWIKAVLKKEGATLKQLNYIFCTDEDLLKINQQYLNHKTYTDIITFDNSELKGIIEGDIFISIERVKENASKLHVHFNNELNRVIVHGVLHLIGYSDKNLKAKKVMRKKEDAYLSLLSN